MTFPIEAGPFDTLDVWLEEFENIAIAFGVGNSYVSAQGAERLLEPEAFKGNQLLEPWGKKFTITWPASFFLVVFTTHNLKPGKFTIGY